MPRKHCVLLVLLVACLSVPVRSADAPVVTTLAATAVTSFGATLNATVNPNGLQTSANFQYGLTTLYGNLEPVTPAPGSGTSPVEVSATVGLACNTTYHFRIAASSDGFSTGDDMSFTTGPCPPPGIAGAVQALAVDPDNPNTVYAGTDLALYRTLNGGTNWSRVDSGLTYTNFRSLAIDPNDHCTIYGGVDTQQATINTNQIVVVSTNCGGNWGFLPGIPPGRVAWSVAVNGADPGHLYVGLSRNAALDQIVRLTPPGTYEVSQPNLSGNYRLATDPANPCTVYAGDFSGNVHKNTTCSGWNWTDIGDLTGAVLSLAVHPTNQATVLAGTAAGRIYRKADAASPWVETGTVGGPVWSLVYAPEDPLIAYAGSADGQVYRSIDGGATWVTRFTVVPAVTTLAVRPVAPSPVYFGGNSFVLTLDPPPAFSKENPGDEAVGVPLAPTLTWTASYSASFEYCYDTTDDNACNGWISTGANRFATLGGLTASTTYYWHVRGTNANGTTYSNGAGTAFWSFTTVPAAPPAAFTKVGPANGATNVSTTPTISWTASAGADVYEYCWDQSNDNSCTNWTTAGPVLSVVIGGVQPGETYYWQVRAFNLAGRTQADSGVFWSFTVPATPPPAAFSKVGPAIGASGLSWRAPLSWGSSAGTDNFTYCVDAVDNNTCDTAWMSPGTPTGTNALTSGLLVGTTYYWQVRAHNSVGTTIADGGTWWSFTVTNFIANGSFSDSLDAWLTFGTPTGSNIVWEIVNGVFQFYRTGTQATVYQETANPIGAGVSLRARFSLGNSSSVRKRVSVLILDSNFSDLAVCTFWLAPNTPLDSYEMRTHSTRPWLNAAIYFYAASTGSNGGHYQVDDVSMELDPVQPNDRTDCVDPTAPSPPGGLPSAELLSNGDFSSGSLSPWGLFGQIVHQLAGGVFEFYRPFGTPSGVILQGSGDAMAAGGIMTATFDLGNTTLSRKRVTVLLHDSDFSDLTACTFWLEPGTPLSPFGIRTFATKAWADATVSVYPSTVSVEQWIQLDNVSLRRTPGATIAGTECYEPGSSMEATPLHSAPKPAVPAAPTAATDVVDRLVVPPILLAAGGGFTRLTFDVGVATLMAPADIEMSLDGVTWEVIGTIPGGWGASRVEIDLSEWLDRDVLVRIVVRASGP